MEAARCFDIEVISIPKSRAGARAKAPSVYLNDRVIAKAGLFKKGTISLNKLIGELKTAGVSELPAKNGGNCGAE